MAKQAMAHAYAANGKRPKESKIFDAKKAHRRIEQGFDNWKESNSGPNRKAMRKLIDAFKGFNPTSASKGIRYEKGG